MIKRTMLGVLISTLLLSGCGSDSGTDVTSTPSLPSAEGHLIGTAATGAPITGQLKLLAADGTITEYAVQEQGAFDFDSVSELKTPALLQIIGGSGGQAHELYSVVLKEQLATRVVNVTPLTQLLISHTTGVAASEVFKAPESYTDSLTIAKLSKAQDELKLVLGKLFVAAGINPDFDLLSSQFKANYTNIDAVLDMLDIQFFDTEAIITYRANREYKVTLPYSSSWTENLLPASMPVEEAAEALSYLITADSILESMILEQDQNDYMAYVHPNASWFGESGTGLWEYKERTIGNEIDTGMDRYRDLSITEVDKQNNRFQVSFTERFENSNFASGGRSHAWFKKDDNGNFKFLGEETNLPVFTSMFVKMESYDTADKEFAYRWWRMQIDAFPSQADCDEFTAAPNGWEWQTPNFSSTLPDVNEFIDLDYVEVSGPGFATPLKLDKVFKTAAVGESSLASCHLVSSEYRSSPVIEGYTFDYDFENPDPKLVPDNSIYTVAYYKNGEATPYYEREVNVGKGISPWDEVLPLMARKVALNLDAGNFYYQWSRVSELVTDTDLWIYNRENHVGAGSRVAIDDGAKEVSRSNLPDIGNVFHASFDPYGRVITRGYFYPSK